MENEIIEVQPQAVVQPSPFNNEGMQPQVVAPAEAFNVEALIAKAIEQGTPVDTMERILAMRRELKAEWAKEAFDRAMAKFQSECPVIEKTKEVRTKSGVVAYRYAPIESIVEQVKAHLQANGFSYSTNMRMLEAGVEVTVKVTHSAGHSETTQMTVPLGTKTDIMSASQVVAAAQTFAKRYAFCNAFGILTGDEDNDAQPMQTTPQRLPAKTSTGPSRAQMELIGKLMKEKGYTKEDLYDNGFTKLTGGRNGTASELIEWLHKARKKEHLEAALPVIQDEYDEMTEEEKAAIDEIKF